MPLYEYECVRNGHRFELIQKVSDPPVETCVRCRSKVRKLLSAPALSFKGSGWYVTDYARKGSNDNGHKGESKADSSGSRKDESGGKTNPVTAGSKEGGASG